MQAHALEWLSLLVRWFHLIAGIGWIGSSFYFMWLDSALEPPKLPKDGVEGELWMVHSGGFYQVEKRLIGTGAVPDVLHWFKYEALFTWISGIFLLGIVYYFSGGVYLIDANRMDLPIWGAIVISLGVIFVSWITYNALWSSRLADTKPRIATTLSFVLLFIVVFGLCHVFSGRAAFVHVGAVLGTIMVANVWFIILPGQQAMIDDAKAGRKPDYSHGVRAKRRSIHNSYVTLPVIFMMFSNHYPSLYAHALNWVVLILMIFLGALIRHIMILETKGQKSWLWGIPAVMTLAVLVTLTAKPSKAESVDEATAVAVTDAQMLGIVKARCQACHSSHPTDDVFTSPPNGVVFETLAEIRMMAPTIRVRVIDTETMPLANKTGMTADERVTMSRWLNQL